MIALSRLRLGPARAAPVRWRTLLAHGLAGAVLAVLLSTAMAQAESRPEWAALTSSQQQALAPLRRDWASIDATRKQKWLEVAARFPKLPAQERARVQQRMAAWAALTPGERADARLHFQETRPLGAVERQARWQAYQALPEEERRRLTQAALETQAAQAAQAARRGAAQPAGAPASAVAGSPAAAATSVTAQRNLVAPAAAPPPRTVAPTVVQAKPGVTTTTMAIKASPPRHHQPGLPKIVATPGFVDPATLLPKRGPQGAAVRAAASSDPTQEP